MEESFLQRQQRRYGGGGRTRADYAGVSGPDSATRPVGHRGRPDELASPTGGPTGGRGDRQAQGYQDRQAQGYRAGPTAAGGANRAPQAGSPAAYYNLNQFQTWAQGRYGQQADQEALTRIGQRVGPAGPQGYNQDQWRRAQQEADVIARARGWRGPELKDEPSPDEKVEPLPGEVGHQGRVALNPSDYERANTGNVDAQTNALMERILANPESLPPQVIAQMKARAKESGLSMAEQLRGNAASSLAGRGFSAGGGQQAGADAAVDSNLLDTLINSNREIDIGAAGQNFNDRLNALQAGSGYMNDAESRAGMRDDRRFRNEEFRYGQMRDDRQGNLQEYLGREGVDLDNRRFDETRRQFNQTFGFDILRFLEDTRRDNRNFGEGRRQHDNNLGLGYGQLNQQGQSDLMNWLSRIYGG